MKENEKHKKIFKFFFICLHISLFDSQSQVHINMNAVLGVQRNPDDRHQGVSFAPIDHQRLWFTILKDFIYLRIYPKPAKTIFAESNPEKVYLVKTLRIGLLILFEQLTPCSCVTFQASFHIVFIQNKTCLSVHLKQCNRQRVL